MQVKFLPSLPARSHWYWPQQDPKIKLYHLRIDIYYRGDGKFIWKIISYGYEPKVLSQANRIKESHLTFAIEQEKILQLIFIDKYP